MTGSLNYRLVVLPHSSVVQGLCGLQQLILFPLNVQSNLYLHGLKALPLWCWSSAELVHCPPLMFLNHSLISPSIINTHWRFFILPIDPQLLVGC